jgi:hypothetical protein
MRQGDLRTVGLELGEKVFCVLGGKVLLGGEHHGAEIDEAERLEIADRVVAQVLVEGGAGRQGDVVDQDRVPVWLRPGDAGRGRRAAGSGDVLDDDLLLQGARHRLRQKAADGVARASRRERHDKRDDAAWIALRRRHSRQRGPCGRCQNRQPESFVHVVLPCEPGYRFWP